MSDIAKNLTGQERYFLKRVRDNVSLDTVKNFLTLLINSDLDSRPNLTFSFADLLKEVSNSSLRFTPDDRAQIIIDPNNRPNEFIYKSDLAFIFFDVINIFLADFTSWYQERRTSGELSVEESTLQVLFNTLIECKNHSIDPAKITGDKDQQLNDLLTNNIKRVAKLLLDLLEIKDKKPEEEKKEEELTPIEENQREETVTTGPVTTAEVETEPESNSGAGEDKGEELTLDKITPEDIKNDPVATKKLLFSKELREQASKFTSIALVQLEQQNGLPPGSLINSPDIQKVLSDKTLGFFLTTLGEGRAKDLIDPETRLPLIREYIWLIQNDFRTTALISQRLNNLNDLKPTQNQPIEVELPDNTKVVLKSEKDLTNHINTALTAAETSSPEALIAGINASPELDNIFTELAKDKLVSDQNNYLIKESTKLLQNELIRVGVQADRISLAETNVVNVIDSWILQSLPLDLLQYVDEGRFKLIFGDEIPYNKDFLVSLEEVWIARRSILGKSTGQILLHNEAKFATNEALALLDENKKLLTKKEADGVFEKSIAAPTKQILISSKGFAVSSPREIIELTNDKKSITNSEKRELFLKQVWEAKDTDSRQEILVFLGYGDTGSKAVQNLAEDKDFYPKEIGLHDIAPLLGGAAFYDPNQTNNYGSNYIPDHGIIKNPLANVGPWGKKNRGLASKLRGGVKGFGSKLSKKAAEKAANKAAEAGLSKAASTATSAIHPALGFLTKLATTKKGRQTLVVVGGLGLAGIGYLLATLFKSLVTGLFSLGGALAGGIIGFSVGGPIGAVVGSVVGGLTGYGLGSWFENLFTGKKGSNYNIFKNSAGSHAASQAGQTAASIKAAATTTTVHIATQAVMGTIAAVAGTEVLLQSTIDAALVADFPIVEPLGAFSIDGVDGKVSEFVEIEKRAFIAGCPENKCESPSFPIKVEYTVIITPKSNYTIQILDATDTLKVNHSTKAWEEKGKTPPTIPERVKNLADFPELYDEMVLEPGDSVTLSYSETLDEKYNDASVTNKFELKVFAKDPTTGQEGTDNAITGEIIYIGDYSQGEGCWPVSGTITQLPFNKGLDSTHSIWDAFDISNAEGTSIYTPFSGKACPGTRDPKTYGIHVILQSDKGTFQFSHMHATNGIDNGCKDVVAGDVIGYMGDTGMGGVHLDWAKYGQSGPPSGLAPMMPDGLGVKPGDVVRSCYDGK